MSADDNKKSFFRKPSCILWTVTSLVMVYAVWCVVVLVWTASGHLLNTQSFACGDSTEFVSRLKTKAQLVYLWSGLNLTVCIFLLLEYWRRRGHYIVANLCLAGIFIIMLWTFADLLGKETRVTQKLKNRYLAQLPLTDTLGNTQIQLTDTNCDILTNVYRITTWQAEFKCCGLEGYHEWESSIPDSCLCDGQDDSSGCVEVGNSLVYEKPCLPTVLSLMEKGSATYWTVMTAWLIIIGCPFGLIVGIFVLYLMGVIGVFIFLSCNNCDRPCEWICKLCCEERVLVVFINKNNNNQTEDENAKDEGENQESGREDGVVLEIEDGTNVEGEGQEAEEEYEDDNPVIPIRLSLLRRLQKELHPPPVQHQVQNEPCMCIIPPNKKTKTFYTVVIEEGSPLLPADAVLVDPNKPTKRCYWERGHRLYAFHDIVWPKDRLQRNPPS